MTSLNELQGENFCQVLKSASDFINNYQKSSSKPHNFNIYISQNGPGTIQAISTKFPQNCEGFPNCTAVDFSSSYSLKNPYLLVRPTNINGADFSFVLNNVSNTTKISSPDC